MDEFLDREAQSLASLLDIAEFASLEGLAEWIEFQGGVDEDCEVRPERGEANEGIELLVGTHAMTLFFPLTVRSILDAALELEDSYQSEAYGSEDP